MNQIHQAYSLILKERIELYGISNLLDEEALCVLTGIPIPRCKEYISSYSLIELPKYSDSFKITKSQKKKLKILYALVKRIALSQYKEKLFLNSSSVTGEYFVKEMQFLREEHFVVALLDAQNRLIEVVTVFKGTINEAVVYPREIVKIVIEKNANSVILCHNHPGGSKQASNNDIEVTKKISNALNSISVKVIDHIIVAENNFISFAEKGLLCN